MCSAVFDCFLPQMCTMRDSAHSYVTALEDVERKIRECPPEVLSHLMCVAVKRNLKTELASSELVKSARQPCRNSTVVRLGKKAITDVISRALGNVMPFCYVTHALHTTGVCLSSHGIS